MGETTHPARNCESCGSGLTASPRDRAVCVHCRLFGSVVAGRTGCIIWAAGTNNEGYGKLKINGVIRAAHRMAYELLVAPIPVGFHLDHLCHTRDTACPGGNTCRHRRCINPHHLEPVSGRTNILRGRGPAAVNAVKTHCSRGHAYSESNTRIDRNGKRHCRACRARYEQEARDRRAAAREALR